MFVMKCKLNSKKEDGLNKILICLKDIFQLDWDLKKDISFMEFGINQLDY